MIPNIFLCYMDIEIKLLTDQYKSLKQRQESLHKKLNEICLENELLFRKCCDVEFIISRNK